MAKTAAYSISPEMALPNTHWTTRVYSPKKNKTCAKAQALSWEDMEIIAALNEAASDMAYIHSCMDHVTEEILIDCLIYELKAVSLRHTYFSELCKQKGIVNAGLGR